MIVVFLETRGKDTTLVCNSEHSLLINPYEPSDVTSEIMLTRIDQGMKTHGLSGMVYLNRFSHKMLEKGSHTFMRKIFWKKPFKASGFDITPVPVRCSKSSPVSAVILTNNNESVGFFSNVLRVRNGLPKLSLYIGDGTTLERDEVESETTGHASVRSQLAWCWASSVPQAVFTNLGKWSKTIDLVALEEKLSKEFGLTVSFARNGSRIKLGEGLQKTLPGVAFLPPHAIQIAEGYQSIIVSSKPVDRDFLGSPLYFTQDNKVYGVLRLLKEFGPEDANAIRENLREKHQMTDTEFKALYKEPKIYYYTFKVEKLFFPPKEIKPLDNTGMWVSSISLQSALEIQNDTHVASPYATIHRSGKVLGRKVTLREILESYMKPIVLKKGYITLMGGIANWGETEGDIDIIQAESREIIERDQPILFRLGRALSPDVSDRLQRKYTGEYGGVFTSHVPLYDLVLVPSERKLVRMQSIQGIKDSVAHMQALKTLKEETIRPLVFVTPLKGFKGYYKFPELAAAEISKEFTSDDYPIYAQKKYDGALTEWMKLGDEIIVRTDAGFNVTNRFPGLIEKARKLLPETCTLLAETEMWVNGQHQPREVLSGYLSSREKPNDESIVVNFFDLMYLYDPLRTEVGDLHSRPYGERYKLLKALDIPSTDDVPSPGFNITPSRLVPAPNALQSAIEYYEGKVASEGTVLKSAKMPYELDGMTHLQLKWKRMAEIHAIVLDKQETKTPGVYTLYNGVLIPNDWKVPEKMVRKLGETAYMYIGKSFNVSSKVNIGDIITLSFHSLFHYHNGEQYITAYEPKFINISTHKVPDDAAQALGVARQKELLVEKALEDFPMDDKPHEAVIQNHYRGKSAHADFRIKVNDHLIGFTMFHEKPGEISNDVETVKQAKILESDWERYFKLSNLPQTQLETMSRKIRVTFKSPEPLDWISVEDVMPKGTVGATKEEYGVFSIVDKPVVYLGAQKAYFKEFFIQGKLMSGRWLIRYLANPWKSEEPRTEFVFLLWKPEDQTPYVLSKRAVELQWIPPFDVSCLPPDIRKVVPSIFKYWVKKDKSERLGVRDALVSAIHTGEVKLQKSSAAYVLQRHWWRGPVVVRGGPSQEQFDFRIDVSKNQPLVHFVLRDNPIETKETLGVKKSSGREWLNVEGVQEIPVNTSENPTKDTPAFIQTIDSGRLQVLEEKANLIKVDFLSGALHGTWTLQKSNSLWIMKSEGM